MHNFQFANGATRLHRLMREGALGDIASFFLMQFTSRNRRLPSWYKDLPLGLFFDGRRTSSTCCGGSADPSVLDAGASSAQAQRIGRRS